MGRFNVYTMAMALLFALASPSLAQVQNQAIVDLQTRPGVTTRYLALAPAQPPRAAVLLFTGGPGVANIPDRPGPGWQYEGNFLVRTRWLFRNNGMFVGVIDAPSDHRNGLHMFRNSSDHAEDIAAVVADMRKRAPGIPVWLVGTSKGTLSAVNAAAHLEGPKAADGIVLTSTILRPGGRNTGPDASLTVFDMRLSRVNVPVLIVHHRTDGCYQTPAFEVPSLQSRLSNSPRVETMLFDGGNPPQIEPCEHLSEHGFFGIERTVVDAIARWILKENS